MIRRSFLLALIVGITAAATTAQAQVSHYLHVPGIDGESLEIDHEKWIDLASFRQVLRPAGSASLCRVEVFKRLDTASPGLWAAAAARQTFPEITLEVTRFGTLFLRQTFVDAQVRRGNFNPARSDLAGESPVESIVLHPASIVVRYSQINEGGGVVQNVEETVICNIGS